jgi:outer membrane protein TolC
MIRLASIISLCWIAVALAGDEPVVVEDVIVAEPSSKSLAVQPQGQVQTQGVPAVADPLPTNLIGQIGSGMTVPVDADDLRHHVPDPTHARQIAQRRLAEATRPAERLYYERVIRRIDEVSAQRPQKLALTLEDVLRQAMAHNLSVRVASYNPAIETARIVEAESRFDAAFAFNVTKNKQNIPVATELLGTNSDTLTITGAITKLLPTGMQATAGLNQQRQYTDNRFQQLNPAWSSNFSVELRQPFLRGFGIDYNRSFITVAKLNQRISDHAFRRQVITTLRDVEEAYWALVQARRDVVINARLLADFQQIYDYLEQRREFDAYRIQISDTKARLERSKASFIQVKANLRNAEDRLIALMNDPEIDLADDIELVPLDFPWPTPVVLDRLSEVQTALDHRPELFEAQLRVKQARVVVGQAKNEALPQLDVTFRYTVDGLGASSHRAFSEVTKNDFHEYFVAVEFQWPIGNRAGRSRIQQARLQHAQSIADLERWFEAVILDVNVQMRGVQSSLEQIGPNFETVQANEDQHEALVARAESKNFVQLNQELNALQALAGSRRTLLQSLIEFSMAIVELERAKGTLPEYNNIVLMPTGE